MKKSFFKAAFAAALTLATMVFQPVSQAAQVVQHITFASIQAVADLPKVAFDFITRYMLGTGMMLADSDIKQLIEDQGKAFEEFKKTNDQILQAKAEGKAIADLEAKLQKINDDVSKLTSDIQEEVKKLNRPQPAAGDSKMTPEQMEHKQAFEKFLRKGDDSGLSELEKKALQSGSDVDGGYLVPTDMAAEIDRIAGTVGVIAGLANVRTVGTNKHEQRVKTSGLSARWVGEGETGGESTNSKYSKIEIEANEIEVEPWVYNSTLEDADYDLEMDVTEEAGIAFGEAENLAFVSGNGIQKPRGILTYDTVANASYAWGKLGYVTSGASGAFAGSNPGDKLIDLLHSLKSQYRQGAVLLMADTTLAEVRKIKDGSGNFYLFNPDPTGAFAGFVLGAPVQIDDNMPTLASNSFSIAYANLQRGYRIVRRSGIALIRDNITTKGTTKFNFRRRVGGGVRNFEAIKLMKFA